MTLEKISDTACFGGSQQRFFHNSETLNCSMHFSVYIPPQARDRNLPVLYWLSGLTCTDENFVQKAGAQRYAAEHGVIIVAPDTSPRGDNVPDDPEQSWDFGLGAGFYVDATEAPWNTHYQMDSYICHELRCLIEQNFPVDSERTSIFGHSMGGHGALTIALRNPERYQSVSAFSPIVAPIQCPWGQKALGNYLGPDREQWKHYDSCELIRAGARQLPMLVDQGEADDFLTEQLKTDLLESTCADSGYVATIRRQAGYDHSYFFIASFIGEHIAFHAAQLSK